MIEDEEFVIVTDVQSLERMLTSAEVDYTVEVSSGEGKIMVIKAKGMNFHFSPDGTLEYMGTRLPSITERSMKGVC